MKKREVITTVAIVVLCIAVIALTAALVYTRNKAKKNLGFPGGFGGMGGQQNAVSVKTQVAEAVTLRDYVNTNGEIETQRSVDVFPSISGKVVDVKVSLGSAVKAGEVIAYIDPSQPGIEYAKSPVIAPITGTITKSTVKPGTQVNASTVIAVIGDVKNLQVSAKVPERYVAALKPGLKAEIVLEAYPEDIFMATVTKVSPVVDSASRTKTVILNFDRGDSRINAGMFAKVKLYTWDYSGYPAVPESCIVEKGNKKYIYIVNDDDTVHQSEVSTGNVVDNKIQLLSGVDEGETVVIEGMRVLSEGARIIDITKGNLSQKKQGKGEK